MKYVGSKDKVASSILSYINSYILLNNCDTYIEPFVGGANIIDKVQCANRIGYDKDKYIIALFKHIQDGGELPEDISREQFTDVRAHCNANDKYYEDWYIAAVGFLIGLNGKFMQEPGYDEETYRRYYQESRQDLLDQMKFMNDVEFGVKDYKELHPHNAVIYCDPPIKNFDYKKFWETMREWSKDNIVIISGKQAPDDFDSLWEQDENSKTSEKLFIHSSINDSGTGTDVYDF